MTVVEDAFRRVLAARLPAGPGWTAWIDGTAAELAASVPAGVTLIPRTLAAELAADVFRTGAADRAADWPEAAAELRELATRLEAS